MPMCADRLPCRAGDGMTLWFRCTRESGHRGRHEMHTPRGTMHGWWTDRWWRLATFTDEGAIVWNEPPRARSN